MQTNNKLMEHIEQLSEVTNSESSETTADGTNRTESQQTEPENSVSLMLDFIAESKVQLESAEAGLHKLGTKPDDREVLNQIFHAFHTIKGMAWFLSLTDIGSLAHSAENLLGLARKGELILGGNNIQAVSASIDMLEIMIVNLKKSIEPSKALTHKVNSSDEKDNTMIFIAKTIMTTNVISVKRQTEVYEAIRTLSENNITGLPVVNDDMSIAGIITEKDVLKLLYDVESTPGKVEDFMTKGVVGFNEDDSLIDITECLIKNSFRRVPITAGGKLVGIISRKDIIAYILKLRHKDKTTG
jgi:CBS domain-containing protein